MLATRTITIALEAKVGGLVTGFKTASQAANDFGSKTAAFAEKNRQAMEGVGTAGLVAGGTLVAGFGKAVATFASFDKAMSSVQAATHESAENMELLSEAAITAGADTAYSAEEAAGAIEELAKAGIATTDILNGGLDGALALAAAGSLDVGEAAEFAASAMTQFGLKGSDIPHIADLLAAGAGKAQGSVRDMGLALSYAGVPAAAMGVSIEDTTGAIALFAKSGIIGEKAGTALRSMLVSMANPTEKTSKLMGELGITFEDAQGKFVGIDGAAQQLTENLGGLEEMERNSALAQIFGNEALGAAVTLYEQGAEGVNAMVDEVNDYGYATETASLMQNNLAGDLEKLGGAFDTVFLKAGSGANGSLRSLVQTAEDFVDKIGEIPAPALSAAAGIAGITGAALLGGGAFFTLAPRVFETVGHFRTLATESPGLTGKLGKVGKAAGIAAVGFVALQIAAELAGSGLDDIGSSEEFETAIRSLSKDADAGAKAIESFASATGSSLTEIEGLGHALETVDLNGFLKGLDWVGSVGGIFDTELGLAQEALGNLDDSLAGLANGGNLEAAAEGFRYAAGEGEKVGKSVEKVSESFPGYIEALRELANETVGGVSETELLNWAMGETPPAMLAAAEASEETAAAIGAVGGEAETAVVPLEDIVEALFALGMISMSSRDSTAAFHDALREMSDATIAAGNGSLGLGAILNETATDFDLTTEAGAAANAAFQNIAATGMTDVENKAREGLGQPELQANLQTTYDSLINAANGMGIVGDDAINLAREVLGVPDNVDINTWMSDAAKRMAGETAGALGTIPGTIGVTVNVSTWGVASAMAGIAGIAAAAASIGSVSTAPSTPWYAPKHSGAGGSGGFASGGAVLGRGTATSDSINARLSNGEHVLTASEVQAMGGQSAVYAFRAQLDAGVPASFSAPAREFSAPPAMNYGPGGSNSSSSIDYDRLAAAINSRPVVANLRIGNRDVAQANIQGRKELRLP